MNDLWNSRERLIPFLLAAAGIHGALLFTVRLNTPQRPVLPHVRGLEAVLDLDPAPTPVQVPSNAVTQRSVSSFINPAASGPATARPNWSNIPVTAHPARSEVATLVPDAAASAKTSPKQPLVDAAPVHSGTESRPTTPTERRAAPTGTHDRSSVASGNTDAATAPKVSAIESPESARLTAAVVGRQISEWTAEYAQMQSRQAAAPSRTAHVEKVEANHRYAADAYERAWQDKVERVGNLNYPEEARRKNLAGRLFLSVGVNADGTLQGITVHRSSGYQELDDAAVRIVRLAAPFSPFPSQLKNDYDVLVITRTWRFFTDHRLATSP